ncbi:hypothetical protein [Ketogulonicigenium vulgare]|uniref:Uncharacterized protein n=1 Tax=Ketogulonicigenium vulgare (strain WSH-001) TaxID=759362 RepID=F9Y8Q6_KETVW|nr:hypothetical protein [Ketogulonicigenium vulgare]ADO43045.1 hypothetical protein EIO_1930 [Ketogulonicigenium vulgare Y25]AEM41225.1 hypothetical protein KVU_1386 [Ketogulonicigenium vulgare WSH-001]ALJ81365.1 hypothetical protein KVH_09325 [Ketogulonicigenium vulgare]ANW35073.1 hypothetical protein KvSKV_09280 [Ketogulonicigenium vulgare]AOZ54956.1 hypothetical protein KVC_1949 [Ketogulonicigenium vulgare]
MSDDQTKPKDAADQAALLIQLHSRPVPFASAAFSDGMGAAMLRAMHAGRAVPRGQKADAPLWAKRDDL